MTLPTTTTCTQISNIGPGLSCSISGSTMTVTGGYSSAKQAFTGTEALSFSATSIVNPRSLKPTDKFYFYVKTSGGSTIYSVNNPTLTITTAATFGSSTISQALGTNGATTSYTWTFTTNSKLVSGDYFKITPPSSITISSPTCTGITGLSSSLTCNMVSGSLWVTVSLTRRRNLASGDPGTYSFSTSRVTNAPSMAPSSAFTIQTLLSDQIYVIEQTTTPTVTNTQTGSITSASASVDSVSLSTAVTYTLTFTPVNYVQGMSLKITLPSELSITDGTYTCTNLKGLIDSTFS